MLKKNISEYEKNIFSELKNSWAILTAGDKKTKYNSMTISWGGIGVIWGKNVCYVFVRQSRFTKDFIDNSDSVTISFLNDDYKKAKEILGKISGRDCDKMALAGLNYTYDPDFDGSYIREADYCFKCKKLYCVDMPYESLPKEIINTYYLDGDMHTLYVCEIKQFLVKEELY